MAIDESNNENVETTDKLKELEEHLAYLNVQYDENTSSPLQKWCIREAITHTIQQIVQIKKPPQQIV